MLLSLLLESGCERLHANRRANSPPRPGRCRPREVSPLTCRSPRQVLHRHICRPPSFHRGRRLWNLIGGDWCDRLDLFVLLLQGSLLRKVEKAFSPDSLGLEVSNDALMHSLETAISMVPSHLI